VLSLWGIFFGLIALVHAWISILRLPNRWKITSRLVRNFTYLLRLILNIKVTLSGDERLSERGNHIVISNHLSYVDGIVLGSVFPVVFVSKKEVKSWPIIGPWTTLCGTVFIDRQHKDRIAVLVEEITRKLKQEANVLLFPEGTSTNGERMLPFQTAPLAAAMRSRAIIVPITLAYKTVNDQAVTIGNRDLVYWYGDMDFLRHFWKLLALRSVEVMVTIQPVIESFRYQDNSMGRKKLSQDCYDRVLGRRVRTESDLDDEDEQREQSSRLLSS
jgi:1-acyl-sn-glycerol-3-phosphate acyltransferase